MRPHRPQKLFVSKDCRSFSGPIELPAANKMSETLNIYVFCYCARRNMSNKLFLFSFPSTKRAIIYSASRRLYSDDIRTIKNVDTASLKRGTGGRSSFNGNVVTVFGATGFIGRNICNKLGRLGCQLIIPYRCHIDDPKLKSLKLVGDLGQVLFQPFDLKDPTSIKKAVKYSNIVINLIGRNFETRNYDFYSVHVRGAKEIAAACKEYNVERLIHFSALNLTKNPEKYYLKKIQFLPTKMEGEEAVRKEFPTATIFRPAAVYGVGDTFLWPICLRKRSTTHYIPLYANGEKTIRQPVYVSDVALGVVNAINDYDTRGKIYQAVGPERYYLKDIVTFCAQTLQKHTLGKKFTMDLKYDIFYYIRVLYYKHFIEAFQHFPGRRLQFELIERESVTDVVDPCMPTLLELGVPLTKFEDVVPNLIFPTFADRPSFVRTYDHLEPVDRLSLKAVKD